MYLVGRLCFLDISSLFLRHCMPFFNGSESDLILFLGDTLSHDLLSSQATVIPIGGCPCFCGNCGQRTHYRMSLAWLLGLTQW